MTTTPFAVTKQTFVNRLSKKNLLKRFRTVRSMTEELTRPLKTEDFVIQVATHASPAKWHLAHSSWFFEAFFLEKAVPGYETREPYGYLFNSYYLQVGDPHCRDKRGNLSRPTVEEIFEYRTSVNQQVEAFFESSAEEEYNKWAQVIEIGINHEQQHQELLITDLKLMLAQNPIHPSYLEETKRPVSPPKKVLKWTSFDEGVYEIGHAGGDFGYDNEFPRHKTYIHSFSLANRLVTAGEYLSFMDDNGYKQSKYWLDEGYALVQQNHWDSPLYWKIIDGEWYYFTLYGLKKIDLNEPVVHVSYIEADAYARWKGCRLPTEQEWEIASETVEPSGHFVEDRLFHPTGIDPEKEGLQQMFGDTWEWTSSSYAPYPGYQTFPGALGEYNGKFMCNQYVLRGGSCATPMSHFRNTYRNFFHAKYRWQFMGIRLAKNDF